MSEKPMTVGELIAKLQQFDASLPVLTGGFDEGGLDPLKNFDLVEAVPVVQTSHGPAYVENTESDRRCYTVTGEPFRALVIDH